MKAKILSFKDYKIKRMKDAIGTGCQNCPMVTFFHIMYCFLNRFSIFVKTLPGFL